MSRNKQRIGLIILLAAVAGAVGWNLWSGWLGIANGDGIAVDVLCAKCGYSGRAESSELSKTGG